MIPESLGAIVAFLLLVTPGFVWDQCVARHVPQQKETVLRETARIVSVSVLATIVSAGALWWLWVPVFNSPDSPVHLLLASAATCLLASMVAFVVAKIRYRGPGTINTGSVMYSVLVKMPTSKKTSGDPRVWVTLENGVVWMGILGGFDVAPEDNNPQLFLKSPIKRKKPAEIVYTKYPGKDYILLPMQRIVSMRVAYPEIKQ